MKKFTSHFLAASGGAALALAAVSGAVLTLGEHLATMPSPMAPSNFVAGAGRLGLTVQTVGGYTLSDDGQSALVEVRECSLHFKPHWLMTQNNEDLLATQCRVTGTTDGAIYSQVLETDARALFESAQASGAHPPAAVEQSDSEDPTGTPRAAIWGNPEASTLRTTWRPL